MCRKNKAKNIYLSPLVSGSILKDTHPALPMDADSDFHGRVTQFLRNYRLLYVIYAETTRKGYLALPDGLGIGLGMMGVGLMRLRIFARDILVKKLDFLHVGVHVICGRNCRADTTDFEFIVHKSADNGDLSLAGDLVKSGFPVGDFLSGARGGNCHNQAICMIKSLHHGRHKIAFPGAVNGNATKAFQKSRKRPEEHGFLSDPVYRHFKFEDNQ